MTRRNAGSFAAGLVLTFALHVSAPLILGFTLHMAAPLILGVISYVSRSNAAWVDSALLIERAPSMGVIFFIGIAQLLYVVPLLIWAIQQQRWEFMKGVIVAAVITVLLNGSCWLLLLQSFI